MSNWTFDAPTGTWQSESVSADLLERAMAHAGVDQLWVATPVRNRLYRRSEYGRATVSPASIMDLVPALSACLRRVRFWELLPHVRRDDASCWVCSCGQEFAPPSDFGHENPAADHAKLWPEHTRVFARRPGKTFAFYGIAAGPAPEDVETLVEGNPIPQEAV